MAREFRFERGPFCGAPASSPERLALRRLHGLDLDLGVHGDSKRIAHTHDVEGAG